MTICANGALESCLMEIGKVIPDVLRSLIVLQLRKIGMYARNIWDIFVK